MESGLEPGKIQMCPPCRVPCSSVKLWQGIVAAGYGDGQVRLYEASQGMLHVQISAHARAVSALDLAPEEGKVSLFPYPCVPLLLVTAMGKQPGLVASHLRQPLPHLHLGCVLTPSLPPSSL